MSRKVFITGAGAGVGLAALRHFAAAGWDVTAAVRSDARAAEMRDLLGAELIQARLAIFDLADRVATDAVLETVIADGVPDVLVNNASVGAFGPTELYPDEQVDLALETNFVAPFRIIRALLPHFRARGNGVIVNVSSGAGFSAGPAHGIYSATKHALEGLSEALSAEVRPFGIRVAVIEPGAVATGFNDKIVPTPGYQPGTPYFDAIASYWERLGATVWKNGILDPETVAAAIYDAATDEGTPLFVPVGVDAKLSASLRGRDDLATYSLRLDQALNEMA